MPPVSFDRLRFPFAYEAATDMTETERDRFAFDVLRRGICVRTVADYAAGLRARRVLR